MREQYMDKEIFDIQEYMTKGVERVVTDVVRHIEESKRKCFHGKIRCRNLIPVLSIEGEKEVTDLRRGAGVYDYLIKKMDELHDRGLIFGASITVTTQNISEVTSEYFQEKFPPEDVKP